MARCKECVHYAVCGKQRFIVQIDVQRFCEYNQVDGVEKYCYEYESSTSHVSPRTEIAEEIFAEIRQCWTRRLFDCDDFSDKDFAFEGFAGDLDELYKKYTGSRHD